MRAGKIVFVIVTTLCLASVVCGDWNVGDPYKMHYPQLPKSGGWDVEFGASQLGDDWKCTESGAVSDVHLWVSWMQNIVQPIGMMTVSIYSDVPAVPGTNDYFSHPGQLLWMRDFSSSQIIVKDMQSDLQGWYDPSTREYGRNDHTMWQQINITNIDKPFYQTEGTIYWLVVDFGQLPYVGWKESYNHFNDDAVWRSPTGAWQELIDPTTGTSIDLSFIITPEPTTIVILAIGGLLIRRRTM
jgi:hypothetical protein